MADELEEMRRMIAQAREEFRGQVARLLYEGARLTEPFEAAVGEVSPADALDGWKRRMREVLAE